MREQSAAGKDLVSKLDFQDATVVAVVAAAMSYKERKMVALITQAVGSFIKLYLLLLFVRVLLTWFPNVDWMRQPWAILRQITDPYLNLFRNLIPPIMGQIDFTPILGFMVLQFLAKVLLLRSLRRTVLIQPRRVNGMGERGREEGARRSETQARRRREEGAKKARRRREEGETREPNERRWSARCG